MCRRRPSVASVTATLAASFGANTVRSATPPVGGSTKQILAELTRVDQEIAGRRFPPTAVYNPLFRQQMGQTYGPLYQQQEQVLAAYAAAVPKAASGVHYLTAVDDARLAFWGDEAAKAKLDAAAAGSDPAAVTDAKLGLMLVDWWSAFGDAAAQGKVADEVEQLIADKPTSAPVVSTVQTMLETNPASFAIGQRLTADLTVKLAKTPGGKAYAAVPNKIDEPLAIDGMQLDGKRFESSAWAGKVVLVDFWATWCPPCREEIPHVVSMYQQYHDQGLEIVGVSSDNDKQGLASFLKEHSDMAWPELFGSTSGWHPLTKKFGIHSIPTMYLIDRNGNLRTIEARSEMEKLIPILLAEPYAGPAPTPTRKTTGAGLTGPGRAPAGPSATPPGGVPADDVHDAVRRAATAGMH